MAALSFVCACVPSTIPWIGIPRALTLASRRTVDPHLDMRKKSFLYLEMVKGTGLSCSFASFLMRQRARSNARNVSVPIRQVIFAVWAVSLCGSGCSLFDRSKNFDAIAQPVSYRLQLPESARLADSSEAMPVEAEPTVTEKVEESMSTFKLVADKSKKGLQMAGKAVLTGVVWVGYGMTKSIIENALGIDDDDDDDGFDPDPLWHQGYGFNNPNNERIRKGKPVLNFDGTEAR